MNRVIKSVAIGVALGCASLWCVPSPVVAGEIVNECHTWTTTTGQDIGHSPRSGAALPSKPFKVPIGKEFSIFVTADTAGAAAAGDTISIAYQVGTNYSSTGSEDNYARWATVSIIRIAKSNATKSFPIFRQYVVGVGLTAIDTNGVGLQAGFRDMDPIINTTASNEHLQVGVERALSTGLGRLVLYGSDADSLITGAWTINGCLNYEN